MGTVVDPKSNACPICDRVDENTPAGWVCVGCEIEFDLVGFSRATAAVEAMGLGGWTVVGAGQVDEKDVEVVFGMPCEFGPRKKTITIDLVEGSCMKWSKS